jgi:hypothetical protein
MRASRDTRVAPPLATERYELLALVGRHPRHALTRVHRGSRRQMGGQAQQPHVPADTDGTGTELRPACIVDVSRVLELEPRPAIRVSGQPDFD